MPKKKGKRIRKAMMIHNSGKASPYRNFDKEFAQIIGVEFSNNERVEFVRLLSLHDPS